MSTAISVVPQQAVVPWKSTSAIKQRAEAIQNLLREVMNEATEGSNWDGDFGKIPGTGGKPSLLKAGSEKILAMFEMAVDPIVEDLSTEDCRRYRVTCRIIHAPSGNFLGSGVGECSTDETKYKWKKTYSKPEFDATDPERRKIKYSSFKDRNGMTTNKEEMQIRTEPADLANTVLKMAKKRAQIDATLTVTGASSMFTQDELEPEHEGGSQDSQKAAKSTKGAKPSQTTKKQEDVKCASCNAINGHLPSCKHHPNNQKQDAKPSTTGQPSQNPPSNEGAKQEVQGEVMPPSKPNASPNGAVRSIVVINSTEIRKKKQGSGDYMFLTVTDQGGTQGQLTYWHNSLRPALAEAIGQECDFEILGKPYGDKTFYQIEHVHRIGSVQYVNDAPVASPSAEQAGFMEEPW